MDTDFWPIIARTTPESGDPEHHARAITQHLVASGTDATLRFAGSFDEALDTLYHWDLWGAAYLALGGCSDDAFEYLRAWVIGAGEVTWALSRDDPQQLFVQLLEGATDPETRWAELGIYAGEPILYAAGRAHEELTGHWLPVRSRPMPAEPAGHEWEEYELTDRFPVLAARLPPNWWGEVEPGAGDLFQLVAEVDRGIESFGHGDHATAAEILEPFVESADLWRNIQGLQDRRIDVAYIVGIGRLMTGDVEGAGAALRLVEADIPGADHVRRALAQVELARGRLDEASRFIIDSPGAARMDRVLATKLAFRRGDIDGVIRRVQDELHAPIDPHDHVWDVAGAFQEIGRILAEIGNVDTAEIAFRATEHLLADAPDDLPLVAHKRLLEVSIKRLRGLPQQALDGLAALRDRLDGTDLAEWHRERARALSQLGRAEDAAAAYQASIEGFDSAGERWEALATRDEAGA
jgi:tetratricopeptide (TPR) repeat protein